ncbi:MAG: hypothetical protein K0S01_1469 [Herbinix sp.]|jgi:hypothetical protein|nr:hypothetical protein [Herbinix sp.]
MKANKNVLIIIYIILCYCFTSGTSATNPENTADTEDVTDKIDITAEEDAEEAEEAEEAVDAVDAIDKNTATDYSNKKHWLSLPVSGEKEVDIFYLYPTVWQKAEVGEPNICEIDNTSMLIGAKSAFENQATAFETVGNIFAPYYRQVDATYCLSLPVEEHEKIIGGTPSSDVIAAFDYYIKNYNNGRPFILAGHSQGSNVLLYLLSDYLYKNPAVLSRMIVAYVIGYSVTDEYLEKNPHLKFAEGPDDTGVIVSYNTEGLEVEGENPVVLPGSIAINPINWSRGNGLATAKENLGSLMTNEAGGTTLLSNYADAQVNTSRGTVICSTVNVEEVAKLNDNFPKGVYHSFDYALYYYNIRENATNRTKLYLSQQ